MSKPQKRYEMEFKQHIVRLVLEEGRTISSVNQEFQLGELQKENLFLKKAAAFFAKELD